MTNNQDITTKGKSMFQYAMHYGLFLGLFWIVQYSLKIAGEAGLSDRFKYLFFLLNVGTFLLIYFFTLRYRESEPEKKISFLRCVGFVALMCFFASFLESAIVYAHFKFIDPGYFIQMTEKITAMFQAIPDHGIRLNITIKNVLIYIYSNKLSYIFFDFLGNTIFGLFMGTILGLLIRIRKI